MRKMVAVLLALVFFAMLCFSVSATSEDVYNSYWINSKGKAVEVPASYSLYNIIQMKTADNADEVNLTDFCVSPNGEIFVLDAGRAVILKIDSNFEKINEINTFKDKNGQEYSLSDPEGIAIDKNGDLVVADTGNARILRLKRDGTVTNALEQPEGVKEFEDGLKYLPSKIIVDDYDRFYVVSKGVNMGFLELDSSGGFISYTGAPPVSVDAFTLFWRRFSTTAQIESMLQFVPTEYNNIAIDEKGFIYGTISALGTDDLTQTINTKDKTGKTTPIRKLNPNGQDILKRQGTFPPVGNVQANALSQMVDVAVGSNNCYSLLDAKNGRVFSYDGDGNLLGVFGQNGKKRGQLENPVAINYIGENIAILDANLGQLVVFAPTSYGRIVSSAVQYHADGMYVESYKEWEKLFEVNPSFDQAYIGVGKSHYMIKDYKKAMQCFKLAGDKENYDMAMQDYRKEMLGSGFGYVIIVVSVLIVICVIRRFVKKIKKYIDEVKNR